MLSRLGGLCGATASSGKGTSSINFFTEWKDVIDKDGRWENLQEGEDDEGDDCSRNETGPDEKSASDEEHERVGNHGQDGLGREGVRGLGLGVRGNHGQNGLVREGVRGEELVVRVGVRVRKEIGVENHGQDGRRRRASGDRG